MNYHIPANVLIWRTQQVPGFLNFGTRHGNQPGIMDGWDMVQTTVAVTYTENERVYPPATHRGSYLYFQLPRYARPWTFVAVKLGWCTMAPDTASNTINPWMQA